MNSHSVSYLQDAQDESKKKDSPHSEAVLPEVLLETKKKVMGSVSVGQELTEPQSPQQQ